jgi:hypothetical protein
MAGAIIDSVTAIFGEDKYVVLGGHDRGARAMQRAAVDIGQGGFKQIKALGLWIADIVPIVAEISSFKNPRNAVGYFHWVSLADLEILKPVQFQIIRRTDHADCFRVFPPPD